MYNHDLAFIGLVCSTAMLVCSATFLFSAWKNAPKTKPRIEPTVDSHHIDTPDSWLEEFEAMKSLEVKLYNRKGRPEVTGLQPEPELNTTK